MWIQGVALLAIGWLANPQPIGHSHNDYERPRPLVDALESRLGSVEADIFLVNGELLVAHDLKDTQPGRTLDHLYLKPLSERAKRTGGHILGPERPFILLVDIKQNGEAVYQRLKQELAGYRGMLTRFEDGRVIPGAVTIILSGDRPIETVRSEPKRLVFIDGRLEDLKPGFDPKLMPLVSDSFLSTFRFSGPSMPEGEQALLRSLVRKTHRYGAILRFWATPDRQEYWKLMADSGTDLINTDQPDKLRGFLDGRVVK